MNLIETLGIEKCRAIVDGAPKNVTHYDLISRDYYDVEDDEIFMLDFSVCICINDIRTAIAEYDCDHDWEDISKSNDTQRKMICTYCSSIKYEQLSGVIER